MRLGRTTTLLLALALVLVVGVVVAPPYFRALSLIVRAANLGGSAEAFFNGRARAITIVEAAPPIRTRHGDVPIRVYEPDGRIARTVLLTPGIHAMGIEEPRLTALARDLAGTGVRVVTMALPDLTRYEITPRSTDVIEDAVRALSSRPDYAEDGRVGMVGISFAGGMSIVAAGRQSIRDRVAFVLSFGGHADLPRVARYLCTGEAPQEPGVETHPPHDYGVAVVLYGMTPRLVPPEQVEPLRAGIRTFLWASQLTLVDQKQADATFAKARGMEAALPEPSATLLRHVNARDVKALGPRLLPHIADEAGSPALSPERAPTVPAAPVYLLHGAEDTVIPAVESVRLARHLSNRGAEVDVLLSKLITHAEVDKTAAASETWKLVRLWAGVLQH